MALWLLPVAGGVVLYSLPNQQSVVSSIFASSVVIPCNEKPKSPHPTIFSPLEQELPIHQRILTFLVERVWEPILTTTRFVHLFFIFIPVIVCSPMLLIGPPEAQLDGDRWGAVWWYDLLVSRMQAAGPTFIKLAQWAASRADLFPSVLCEKLGSLHSRGRPHSMHHTKRVIESVFRRPFDDVFEEFDETPIGTGAIAQVYKAVLKKDLIPPSFLGPRRQTPSSAASLALKEGLPSVPTASVAIKILHPRVSKMISRDLSIMSFFAHAINLLPGMQWLSFPEEAEVFGQMMSQQLDLRNEAQNLLTFEDNFEHRRVPVTFPRPLRVWSTQDLLVEEFEEALPMESFLRNGGGPYDEQLATVGLNAFLNMLLLDNFVHADLHPGNILVKFMKPRSAKVILQDMFSSLLGIESPQPKHEAAESDEIVSSLRPLSKNRSEWLAKLEELHKEGYIPEIVFIDAGLITTLSATNRQNFLELFRAIAYFDGYKTGKLMVERSRSPELAIDTEVFALKMQNLVLSVKRKTFSLGQIKISDVLRDVLKAVREHHVKLEADFVNTVISVLLLEGIGRRLDPGLDLFKSSLPILRQVGGAMAVEEGKKRQLPSEHLSLFALFWILVEARSLANAAFVNADDLIKYDWLTPGI